MNEARMKSINTFIENPVFTVDRAGGIMDIDNGQTKIWGYLKEELIGMNVIDLLDRPYKQYALQLICGRIGESQYSDSFFSVVILSKYGEKIKVRLSVQKKKGFFKVELSKEFKFINLVAS